MPYLVSIIDTQKIAKSIIHKHCPSSKGYGASHNKIKKLLHEHEKEIDDLISKECFEQGNKIIEIYTREEIKKEVKEELNFVDLIDLGD